MNSNSSLLLLITLVNFTIISVPSLLIAFIVTSDKIVEILGNANLHIYDVFSNQDIIAGDVFFEIVEPIELQYTYRLRPAKNFGGSFNASFKLDKIPLVPVAPLNACSKILNRLDIKGNVALIERGECSFLTKTINVEEAGAKAAIITQSLSNSITNNEFDYYIEMIHDNTSRDANIPAGFLVGRSGHIVLRTLKKLHMSYAIINLPINLTFIPPHKINHPPWLGW